MDKNHLAPTSAGFEHPAHVGPSSDSGQEYFTQIPVHPSMASGEQGHVFGPKQKARKLVLCFDGTGNKFQGDDSDTNILKIYRMLDRNASDQYHYYQPGIGTYVVSGGLGHHSIRRRISSWYAKAKDSAIGSSFDQHVVGGYRFLMRFYTAGDEIYIFGFSRGAYIARFLAEMLDYVGLLSHGNEEMVSFAWKAFSQWQCRRPENDDSQKKHEMYSFLRGFRETFSRPVRRIRFLGLFDTVNSVPRFETAWMERSKFPYTARSSAKVIRHAVSIDERRAKFRQDLVYQKAKKESAKNKAHGPGHAVKDKVNDKYRAHKERKPPHSGRGRGRDPNPNLTVPGAGPAGDTEEVRYRPRSRSAVRSRSRASRNSDATSVGGPPSDTYDDDDDDSSDDDEQDIDEIWFSGGHGDVGGGWEVPEDGKSASHVPLAWMVHEAMRAGLSFDMEKVKAMQCADCSEAQESSERPRVHGGDASRADGEDAPAADHPPVPDIMIRTPSDSSSPTMLDPPDGAHHEQASRGQDGHANGAKEKQTLPASTHHEHEPSHHHHLQKQHQQHQQQEQDHPFHNLMHKAHTAVIHDSLTFSSAQPFQSVLAWRVMEYLPFRRMDLRHDGSWKPIRWPLPRGEVRDVPNDARVHGSVIRRMRADDAYRPGNLIVGGGGRGVRRAPDHLGMGDWVCVANEGDPIGEVWVRRKAVEEGGRGKEES